MKTKSQSLYLWLLALVILSFIVAGRVDYETELAEQRLYCDMVGLWVDSDGQYGWPDYKAQYERWCK